MSSNPSYVAAPAPESASRGLDLNFTAYGASAEALDPGSETLGENHVDFGLAGSEAESRRRKESEMGPGEEGDDEEEKKVEGLEKVVRRRGRPRKKPLLVESAQRQSHLLPAQDESKVEQGEGSGKVAKKRGRPKKKPFLVEGAHGDIFSSPFLEENKVEKYEDTGKVVKRRGRPKKQPSLLEYTYLHSYSSPFQDEGKLGFSLTDLVWGKVKSHPWWPAQIFDPSCASEMASIHEKKDHFLVAYFGDKTFAWNDESLLRPFQTNFSQMEKQSSAEAFVLAVDASLAEVARRVDLAMACNTVAVNGLKDQKVENAGLKGGTNVAVVDNSFIANSFQPEKFLEYILGLAQLPTEGVNRLDLVIAKAQLKAFYRSKGYPDPTEFVMGEGMDNNARIPAKRTRSGKSDVDYQEEPETETSDSASEKKRPRHRGSSSRDGRKKRKLSDLTDKKVLPRSAGGGGSGSRVRASSRLSGRKCKVYDSDSDSFSANKKKSFDSLGRKKLPAVLGSNGEASQKRPRGRPRKNSVADDTCLVTPMNYSSPSEMLSQLCLSASDPTNNYSSLSTVVSFFTKYKDSSASGCSDDTELLEMMGGRNGIRRSANSDLDSLDVSPPSHMQDSYWSDIVVSESAEEEQVSRGQKRKIGSDSKRERKSDEEGPEESLVLHSVPVLGTAQELQAGFAGPNIEHEMEAHSLANNLTEKVEECTPTSLVLHFSSSEAVPSESDLIKIFGRYGPLREAETEILKEAGDARVVFNKRADAEVAFSSAGKFRIFGSALVSFRLNCLQSTPKSFLESSLQDNKGVLPVEGDNPNASVQENASGSDAMHIDRVSNGSSL